LVDCSLLTPPRNDPDGRARYLMLETLRAFGLDRLAEAGEQPGTAARQATHALAIVTLVARGYTDAQIAGELYISISNGPLSPGPDPG
jgi:hypothetical protein